MDDGEFETFLTVRTSYATKTKLKEKKMKRTKSTASILFVTRAAVIGAMYIALTYLSNLFGLASGVIQLRLSEALLIMPVFFVEAIPGLYVGCILSNILTGCAPWAIVFGSLATLIGALLAYALRNLPKKLIFLATVPNILSNTAIVPFILAYVYGAEESLLFIAVTVAIGEIIACGVFGTMLYYPVSKMKKYIK